MIKSFRGFLEHDKQQTIRLSTNDGMTGYKIVKFQLFTPNPGATANAEHIVKIYKYKQGAIDGVVDFNDSTLLGAGFLPVKTSEFTQNDIVIFDNVTFNQDIYVTVYDAQTTTGCNYYIELEQVRLELGEATVATLKDMRGSN